MSYFSCCGSKRTWEELDSAWKWRNILLNCSEITPEHAQIEKGFSRVAGFTGTTGWGRLVSTPQRSNPYLYFGNTPVLCRTLQQGRVVLLLLNPKTLFNPVVRWPLLHNAGVSRLGMRRVTGSSRGFLLPAMGSLILPTEALFGSFPFDAYLWGSCTLRWTTWQKYLSSIQTAGWQPISFF